MTRVDARWSMNPARLSARMRASSLLRDGGLRSRVSWARRSDGWHVSPFPGDGVSEHVSAGLVLFNRHVGVVGVSSSGHWCVDASAVGGDVDEEECGVDGPALAGVAGLCVAELDVSLDIVGGKKSRFRSVR